MQFFLGIFTSSLEEDNLIMSERKPIGNCKHKDFVEIISRACDSNYVYYHDKKIAKGYLPDLGPLRDSDGVNMKVCVECGWIIGMNPTVFRRDVEAAYQEYLQEQSEKEISIVDTKKKVK